MRRLVALDMQPGPRFVEELQRIWDKGDAALPLDPRLPSKVSESIVNSMRPSELVDQDGGTESFNDGLPTEEGTALVVPTSGSTGNPKGVTISHAAMLSSAAASSERLGVRSDEDWWISCLPLSHVGGLSVVFRSLLTGTKLTVLPSFSPELIDELVYKGANLISVVPTHLSRYCVDGFKRVLVGGSKPPETLPSNCIATYGMTETASGVVYNGVPLAGVEVSITEDSEILLRGPMVASNYRDGTPVKAPDGWLHTGDSGLLEGGKLTVIGRKSELIITGGENVWPARVEGILQLFPGFADVGIGSRPDPEWGERIIALAVAAPGSQRPSLDEVRDFAREYLEPWAIPKALFYVENIPRTALGKIARHDLASTIATLTAD